MHDGLSESYSPSAVRDGALDGCKDQAWVDTALAWLISGLDTPELLELASQGRNTGEDVVDLMRDAVRSLGLYLPTWQQFLETCSSSIDEVQRDLNATNYGQFKISAVPNYSKGIVLSSFVSLPSGFAGNGDWAMTSAQSRPELLASAALATSQTLLEIAGVEWPLCRVHGHSPDAPFAGGVSPAVVEDRTFWFCNRHAGHQLGAVGYLEPRAVVQLEPQ